MSIVIVVVIILIVLLLAVLWWMQRARLPPSAESSDAVTIFDGDSFAETDTVGLNLAAPTISFDLNTTSAALGLVLYLPPPPLRLTAYSTVLVQVFDGNLDVQISSQDVEPPPSQTQLAPKVQQFITMKKIDDGVFHAITLSLTPTNFTLSIDGVVAKTAPVNAYNPIKSNKVLFGGYQQFPALAGSIRSVKFGPTKKTLQTRSL